MGEVISLADRRKGKPIPILSKEELDEVVKRINELLVKSEEARISILGLGTVSLREKAVIKSHNLLMDAHALADANGLKLSVEESPGHKRYVLGPK